MLRWQRFGACAHAVDGDHQPVAGELIRALCGACRTVSDQDVQAYHPAPLAEPCEDCREVWDDMDGGH
jgi:hypothetical protein